VSVTSDLVELFGDYLASDRESDWSHAKTRLPEGGNVSGEVVARYPFGVFVDIGVGFPALLEVIQFEDARERRYASLEEYPSIGSTVSARVVAFSDRSRQVGLTQLKPHPYLDRKPVSSEL
jgi:ribosomal protein S1